MNFYFRGWATTTVVVLLVLVTVPRPTASKRVSFEQCQDDGAEVNYVDVAPCPNNPSNGGCKLVKGCNSTITIGFVPQNWTERITNEVYAELFPRVKVPYAPMRNIQACSITDPPCPLTQGDEVKYEATFPVLPNYPTISKLKIIWVIKNDQRDSIVCIKLKVGIATRGASGTCPTD